MTVLVYAVAPPLVLSPICLVLGRWLWFRRTPERSIGILKIVGISIVEILLWASLAASLVIAVMGNGGPRMLAVPPLSAIALWLLSGVFVDRLHKAGRWFYLLTPPLVLFVLLAVTWLVLLYVEELRIL